MNDAKPVRTAMTPPSSDQIARTIERRRAVTLPKLIVGMVLGRGELQVSLDIFHAAHFTSAIPPTLLVGNVTPAERQLAAVVCSIAAPPLIVMLPMTKRRQDTPLLDLLMAPLKPTLALGK